MKTFFAIAVALIAATTSAVSLEAQAAIEAKLGTRTTYIAPFDCCQQTLDTCYDYCLTEAGREFYASEGDCYDECDEVYEACS